MKKWYLSLAIMVISSLFCYGQERFFEFVEGWKASVIVEQDFQYTAVGTGLKPSNYNKIVLTNISKSGQYLTDRDISLDSTMFTEIRNGQSFSTHDNEHVMGVTVGTLPDLLPVTKNLRLNEDLTEILDSTWQYISNPNGAIMYGTLQTISDKILHSIQTYNGVNISSRLLQVDTLGSIEWEGIFTCSGYCDMEPRHIIPAHDGGYLFTNEEKRSVLPSGGPGDHNVATIIKVDSLGNQEWRIYPGGTGFPYTSDYILAIPTDDGNYLCAWADNELRMGNVNIAYNTNPDATIWFAKINPLGEKLWEKNIQQEIDLWNMDQNGYSMRQIIKSSDGNIVLTVSNKLVKITQDAEVIWIRSLKPELLSNPADPTSYVILHGLEETSDNGFICACEAWVYPGSVFPEFTQSGCVVKVDEYGCLEPDCHLNDPVSTTTTSANHAALKLFPNPAQDYINIEYSTAKPPTFIAVNITDLAGRVVHAQVLENQEQYLTISTKDLPSGQYFCQLFVDGTVDASRKFVVAR